jgi:SAM-dependent methyltransferase
MTRPQKKSAANNKMDKRWWGKFVSRSHYFDRATALGELKLREYLGFINRNPIHNSHILKTDLFVEAKDLEDNYLPRLTDSNRFVGMDISIETVKIARAKLIPRIPGMMFVVCDVNALPFQSEVFDTVVSDSTLDHIPLAKLPFALQGLARVLKNKGRLILSLNSVYNLPAVIKRKIRNVWDPGWFFTFSVSLNRVFRLLKKTGFHIQDSAYILPIHPFEIALLRMSHPNKIASLISEKWVFIFQKIIKKTHLGIFFCTQFIVSAKKEVESIDCFIPKEEA